jgi:hypothetical protein
MLSRMIHRIYRLAQGYFRPRRMRLLRSRLVISDVASILDIGGTGTFWCGSGLEDQVTLLNIRPDPSAMRHVIGDATQLPFKDGEFDLAFSNSVLEHLRTWQAQQRFASEARRVGRSLWIQTPARWFPIEPHYLTPLIHFFPLSLRRRLLRNFSVWGWITRPTPEQVEGIVDEIRLVTYREMQRLFPDCQILRERVLGMTKSFIAVKQNEA